MSPAETSRVCCICKKLFCCVECRERHEKNKHSDKQLNCPLCSAKKLPLRVLEDKSLLCHIVINHLPLYCCLCGEIFKQGKDLETFGTCAWYQSRNRHSLVSNRKPELGTPPFATDNKRTNQSSIGSEYNDNFATLTSPPELYRNTSTPMIVGQKTNLDFKTPIVPNFTLKTPKTNSASLKNQTRDSLSSDCTANISKSQYFSFSSSDTHPAETPFRVLSSNRTSKEDNSTRNNSGRKLDIMKEEEITDTKENQYINDNHCVEDMELTGVEGQVVPDSQNLDILHTKPVRRRSDSIKKVRFSDQYEIQPEPSRTSIMNATENEEFFEARETTPDISESMENSQLRIYRENERNTEKENQTPDGNKMILNQQSSGTSRVVMMVVVENNSALSSTDLAPLIDSGLKKLERASTSARSSNLSEQNSPSYSTNSITSMDSYYSLSSFECYSSSSSISSPNREESKIVAENKDSASSGGIFSAVAHAVRTVMKNFSGASTSGAIAREQVSQREDVVMRAATVDTNALTNLASSLLSRPGKRTRDLVESSSSTTSSSARQMDVVVPQIEPRSPVAKRHRGWYRIKGREPIARMRSRVTSPRGISSETQVFSQGSLSVGDTVLPLPVRAHQSTQTE